MSQTPSSPAATPRLPTIRRTDEQGHFRPDLTNSYIGLQIRTGRRLMGFTRGEMADRLGIEAAAVAAYEHGVRDVPVLALAQIADLLDKPVAWFLHRPATVGRLREQPVAAPQAEAPTVARRRVLLVDDAPDVLVTLGAFLEGAGLEVVRARSGDEALGIVASDVILHAIVTDNAMPGLSGTDLLLQSAQMRPDLPGLIVTGFADTASLGVLPASVGILCKPFRREELVSRVQAMTQPKSTTTDPAPAQLAERLVARELH